MNMDGPGDCRLWLPREADGEGGSPSAHANLPSTQTRREQYGAYQGNAQDIQVGKSEKVSSGLQEVRLYIQISHPSNVLARATW